MLGSESSVHCLSSCLGSGRCLNATMRWGTCADLHPHEVRLLCVRCLAWWRGGVGARRVVSDLYRC